MKECKAVKFELQNVFLKEIKQIDKKTKKQSDLSRITLITPRIDQKDFDGLCISDGYRIDIKISYIPYSQKTKSKGVTKQS